MRNSQKKISRRDFMGGATKAVATFSIVPGYVLGRARGVTPPSEKLNIAGIGVGGRGGSNIKGLAGENIVALCDVDWRHAADTFKKLPKAKRFRDFGKMLEKMDKDIDAVAVSTPDHTHAVAAMMAIKMGKHVYCEKPLAHSIYEVRTITEAARKHKVATQLGNQGHSSERIRMFCEWIWDGAIGKVTEVHAIYSGSYNRYADLDRITEKHPIPRTLNWDLWLGPAPYRTYHPMYLPGKWRGWMQFGTGAIGDWVCHVLDPVFWALKLGAPMTVQADTFDYDLKKHGETFPAKSIVRYEFPARADSPPVKLTWYEGGAKPPRPEELEPGRKLPDICAIVIGDKGKIVYGSHGAGGARIIPDAKMKAYEGASRAPKTIPRSKGHYGDWIEACKGGKPASSNFDYGGPLTEIALLGIIATRTKNTKLQWDSKNMRITNCEEANQYINPPYRSGWTL